MSVFLQTGTGDASQDQLVEQISQLHLLVQEMKDGFASALQELASIQRDDQALHQKIEDNKIECRQEISEIAQMVAELKSDFGSVQSQLQVTTETQQTLKEQIEYLQYERDLLVEELEKSGSISERLRKNHQKQSFPSEVTKDDQVNGNMDDLKELEEKNEINTNHGSRHGDRADGESNCSQPLSPPSYSKNTHTDFTTTDDNQNYESDSSITQAATLSLTLSRSLHNKFVKSHITSDEEELTSPEAVTNQQTIQSHFQLNRNEGSGASRNSSFGGHDERILSTPSKEMIDRSKRQEIAFEILETEKKYVNCLSILEKNFATPLRQSSILPARDVNAIFPAYLSVFYQRHQLILKQIEERVHNRKYEGMLGDVFARLTDSSSSDLLQCYSNYVTDFPNSIDMINQWSKQSQKFRKFLKKQLAELNSSNIGLATFLLAPLQRIPKYVLLLQQLLKFTEEENPDYYYMQTAVQGLNDFINNMNTAIEDAFKILSSSRQTQAKQRDSDISQLSSISSGSVDLHKLSQNSTALSVTSQRDSGVHSMVPSVDDFDLEIDSLLPDNNRSSLDKLRKYKFHRKSSSEEKRHSQGKYSSEENEKMTLSFQLNPSPVETQIRRRRKDKSHGRSRGHKELSVGQDESGRLTPNVNLYSGPSRSLTDTQLNVTAMTGQMSLPQTLSMYSYQSLPGKDAYTMQYPNYDGQNHKGSNFVDIFDDVKYSSAGYLNLTPPDQQMAENSGQINGIHNTVPDPQMNIQYNQSEFAKPKQKSEKQRGLPKRPSFGIYGNRDEDTAVYIPSRPGQGPSRKEQYRLHLLQQQQQQQQQYQQEQLQATPNYSPIRDSPSPVTGNQDQRYPSRPTSRTPVSMEYNSPYSYDETEKGRPRTPYNYDEMDKPRPRTPFTYDESDKQRSRTPSGELNRPQIVTGVWEEDKQQQQRRKIKNKPPKTRQKSYEVGEKSAKRPSLRDSLRTIFFKKRGQSSRVLDFGTSAVMNNTGARYANSGDTDTMATHPAQSPVPFTYEDENGDPCSAV